MNFADNLLNPSASVDERSTAIITIYQKGKISITWNQLRHLTRKCAGALSLYVKSGDCVAGFVGNTASAVIAALATTYLGAMVWNMILTPPPMTSAFSHPDSVEGLLDLEAVQEHDARS